MPNDTITDMKSALQTAFAANQNLTTPIDRQIHDLVMHGAENCVLVAMTNIAATAVDPSVLPTLLTRKAGGLDFRSLYKKTTRPVLVDVASSISVSWSPSSDPFVSNPFREDEINQGWVDRRNNKLAGAGHLKEILEFVGGDQAQAQSVLHALAAKVIEKLGMSQVHYNLPPRLTTSFVASLLTQWLSASSSKGARLEHVAIALLRFAGQNLVRAWDEVVSHHVNDPKPFDAICLQRGKPTAIAECKDQVITVSHINQLVAEMGAQGAAKGYLFTRQNWLEQSNMAEISAAIQSKSVFGYRVDIVEISEAIRSWLSIIDQSDAELPAFMSVLTTEMGVNGNLDDRRELASLIDSMLAVV